MKIKVNYRFVGNGPNLSQHKIQCYYSPKLSCCCLVNAIHKLHGISGDRGEQGCNRLQLNNLLLSHFNHLLHGECSIEVTFYSLGSREGRDQYLVTRQWGLSRDWELGTNIHRILTIRFLQLEIWTTNNLRHIS